MAVISLTAFFVPILPLPFSCFSFKARAKTYFLISMIKKSVTSALIAAVSSLSSSWGRSPLWNRRIPKVPVIFCFSLLMIFEVVSMHSMYSSFLMLTRCWY
ncbi:hypothetical protein EDC96DRAFT_509194 [Choanephora cucurbitarum]|nr:hypothetical protein EDC96DRAFT_509194 [Choanephora cucurbitarum]